MILTTRPYRQLAAISPIKPQCITAQIQTAIKPIIKINVSAFFIVLSSKFRIIKGTI